MSQHWTRLLQRIIDAGVDQLLEHGLAAIDSLPPPQSAKPTNFLSLVSQVARKSAPGTATDQDGRRTSGSGRANSANIVIDGSEPAEERMKKMLMKTRSRKVRDVVHDSDLFSLILSCVPMHFIWNLTLRKARSGTMEFYEPHELRQHECVLNSSFLFRYSLMRKLVSKVVSSSKSGRVLAEFLSLIVIDIFTPPLANKSHQQASHDALDRLARQYAFFFQWVHSTAHDMVPPPATRTQLLTPTSAVDAIMEWYPYLIAHAACESLLVLFPGEPVVSLLDRAVQMRLYASAVALLKGGLPSAALILERRQSLWGPVETFEPLPPAIRSFALKEHRGLGSEDELDDDDDDDAERKRKHQLKKRKLLAAHKDLQTPPFQRSGGAAVSGGHRSSSTIPTATGRLLPNVLPPTEAQEGAKKKWGKLNTTVAATALFRTASRERTTENQESAQQAPTAKPRQEEEERAGRALHSHASKSEMKRGPIQPASTQEKSDLIIEVAFAEEYERVAKIEKALDKSDSLRSAPGLLSKLQVFIGPVLQEVVQEALQQAAKRSKTMVTRVKNPDEWPFKQSTRAQGGAASPNGAAPQQAHQHPAKVAEVLVLPSRPQTSIIGGMFLTEVETPVPAPQLVPLSNISRSGTPSVDGQAARTNSLVTIIEQTPQGRSSHPSALQQQQEKQQSGEEDEAEARQLAKQESEYRKPPPPKPRFEIMSMSSMSPLIGRFLGFPATAALLTSSAMPMHTLKAALQTMVDKEYHIPPSSFDTLAEDAHKKREFLRVRQKATLPRAVPPHLLPPIANDRHDTQTRASRLDTLIEAKTASKNASHATTRCPTSTIVGNSSSAHLPSE